MPGKAPVNDVGGRQDSGPWPSDVEEIVEGKAYRRPVRLADGTTQEVQATVTSIQQVTDSAGDPTTGYAVSYVYDDPTTDGDGA